MSTLQSLYDTACRTNTDIHQHLPVLRSLAAQCGHVTEMGVRTAQSTIALLSAQPKVLVSYDIVDCPAARALLPHRGQTEFSFVVGDSREITIEPTELLFIDTLHIYDQLKVELERHASKVSRWIVLHDTTTFGEHGEVRGTKGLWRAVEEFLELGEFKLAERRTNNNGLTTLERVLHGHGK